MAVLLIADNCQWYIYSVQYKLRLPSHLIKDHLVAGLMYRVLGPSGLHTARLNHTENAKRV